MLTLLHGDALTKLAEVEGESVQTCVTSPPYWGLRDYGVDPIVWDNHNGCEHSWSVETRKGQSGGVKSNKVQIKGAENFQITPDSQHAFCDCGAWRGCLGLEPTPELYVQHLVQIFREVKRILRKDGTVWLNLGDSYAGGHQTGRNDNGRPEKDRGWAEYDIKRTKIDRQDGLKPKDLVGIPWMVAFALRSEGWYLRMDVVWAKRSWMPESVTDRPTKSHEYIFLLSKSEKYYYDQDAVREPYADATAQRLQQATFETQTGGAKDYQHGTNTNRSARRALENLKQKWDNESGESPEWVKGHSGYNKADGTVMVHPVGRNRRSVWTVAPQPFSDAHFATFPTEIPTICILAGSKAGDTVLDPFAGSGTTGKVAIELGRKAILIEPKAEYVEMIERRCRTTIGLPFVTEASPELSLENQNEESLDAFSAST